MNTMPTPTPVEATPTDAPSSASSAPRPPVEPGAPATGGGIPLAVPEIGGNEWAYVKECLDTGWVSSAGAYVTRFEREMAERAGTAHGVATVNGTAALHTALLVAGVGPGDEVLVSDLTFVAPVNAVCYTGAVPVLVDAEPTYWQIDADRIAAFLTDDCERRADAERGEGVYNKTTGRRVAAVIPVHILGHPVDLDAVVAAVAPHGVPIIEDASEALGASYRGAAVGHHGDAACFSFNGNKIVTAGGGGMLVTSRADWTERARYLTTQAKDDPVEYVHEAVGYNYRLTNLAAAVGVAQLERLDDFVAAKRRIAARYNAALAGIDGLTVPAEAEWATSSCWLYTVLVSEDRGGSRPLLNVLAGQNIQTRPLWRPMHLLSPFAGAPVLGGAVSERLYAESLSLPCSVGLTKADQDRVIAAILAWAA